MTRIAFEDNPQTAIIKLAEGNPGAAVACARMAKGAEAIDPDSVFGVFAPLLSLDIIGIYGSGIHVFYKDVCGSEVRKGILLLRAVQLGLFSASRLVALCAEEPDGPEIDGLEWASLDQKVCGELPGFQKS